MRVQYGTTLVQHGHNDRAAPEFAAGIRFSANNHQHAAVAHANLGMIHADSSWEKAQLQLAEEHLSRALALAPSILMSLNAKLGEVTIEREAALCEAPHSECKAVLLISKMSERQHCVRHRAVSVRQCY